MNDQENVRANEKRCSSGMKCGGVRVRVEEGMKCRKVCQYYSAVVTNQTNKEQKTNQNSEPEVTVRYPRAVRGKG